MAYMMYTTVPVAVVMAERSLSKPKLIKNLIPISKSKGSLIDCFAMLSASVENEPAKNSDFRKVIQQLPLFSAKARRKISSSQPLARKSGSLILVSLNILCFISLCLL